MTKADTAAKLEELSPYGEYFPWATEITGRTNGSGWNGGQDFKRHRTLAQARSAITTYFSNGGNKSAKTGIYRWNELLQEWQEYDS